jgi:hypothetical protein
MEFVSEKNPNQLEVLQKAKSIAVFVQPISLQKKYVAHVAIESIVQRKEVGGNKPPLK